ncbi:sensor histidine kinase [Kineococcus glutinatus]|uniref:Oxygen sensor histidine kinase NreB n=1 Tax=Kineococcus glutinatus TaxID=1070872 RepID=A0ABP8VDD4_9ACTN
MGDEDEVTSPAERWAARLERWQTLLVYPLLVVSAALAAVITEQGWSTWQRWWQLLGVAVLVAALTAWFEHRPRPARVQLTWYALRWALCLVLVLGNPFYGVFAWVGYVDAIRFFPFRRALWGIAATAVLIALSQSAGPPEPSPAKVLGFVLLWAFNAALVTMFSSQGLLAEQRMAERRAAIAELTETNRRLRQAQAENAGLHAQLVAQAREAGVLDERARLAREIHDTIAQGLTGIVAQLQAAESESQGDPQAWRPRVATAVDSARECLAEARRSVGALRPVALDGADLPAALWRLAARAGAPVRVVVTGEPGGLPPAVAEALLRTAQEALSNAARHARGSGVTLTLSGMEDVVTLDVRDDGRGFDPAAVPGRGFGLESMRQRVALVGGSLHVESAPGEGTAVCAQVPVRADARAVGAP